LFSPQHSDCKSIFLPCW